MTEPHNYSGPTESNARDDRFYLRPMRHVSWGAIIAGLIIAIALQILLGLLGIGLGLTILNPTDPMGGMASWGIGTGIYIVLVQVLSLFAGGYIASRLSPARTDQTAMFHGLTIWALATILMVWMGGSTVGLAFSGLTNAVSTIGKGTAQAVETVIPENLSLPNVSFDSLPDPIKERLRQNGITPENFQQELQGVYREVVSEQEQQQLMRRVQEAIRSIMQNPTQAPEEVDQAIDDAFGQGGILSEQDLEQMQNTLQQRLNISEQEAQQIRDQVQQTVDEARTSLKEGVQTARQEAAQAAQTATDAIASVALWLFVANLLALIAAVVGGRAGEVKTPA